MTPEPAPKFVLRDLAKNLESWCSGHDAVEDRTQAEKTTPPFPWPICWPLRALLDLERLSGTPLQKAQALKPVVAAGGMVALLGDRGRGKTVMAAWLANERRQQGREPGIYLRAFDLFEAIRETFNRKKNQREYEDESLVKLFRNAPFLVIDEIQERGETEWENRTLVNILDHRHANILPTLLIGNLGMKELNTNLGPSIVDRMSQTGAVVDCAWENFRSSDNIVYTQEQIDAVDWSGEMYHSREKLQLLRKRTQL